MDPPGGRPERSGRPHARPHPGAPGDPARRRPGRAQLIVFTAEAKSILLAYEMAKQAGQNEYVIARKTPKLYMEDLIMTNVDSITTEHVQRLCIGKREANMIKDRKVLIVDDVISTGQSLASMEYLVEQAGGQIVGKMAVLAEGDAIKRDDIIVLEQLPLFNSDGSVKE